jgi:hypothetical protein
LIKIKVANVLKYNYFLRYMKTGNRLFCNLKKHYNTGDGEAASISRVTDWTL